MSDKTPDKLLSAEEFLLSKNWDKTDFEFPVNGPSFIATIKLLEEYSVLKATHKPEHTLLLRNLSDLTLEDYPDGLESIGHQSDYRDENGNIREFVFIDEANQYIELLLKHNKNE